MAVNDIANHYVKTFEANAIHLVQQKLSKFRSCVTEKSPGATVAHSFRTVEARGAMTDRASVGLVAGKRPATAYADTQFNDRVCVTTPKTTADSYSKPDLKRMLEDPQSEIYKAMVPQVGRTFDDVINAALMDSGPNTKDTLGNTYAFGAVGTTPTVGGAAIAFSLSLCVDLLEGFNTDDVDPDEEKFLFVSPAAVSAMLLEPKATSVDYVNARALMSGKVVEGYMGFTWRMSNRLTHPAGGQTYCPAFTRDAIGLLVLQDINLDVGQAPEKQFDTIMQVSIDIGAVRIQEKKVKRIHFLE